MKRIDCVGIGLGFNDVVPSLPDELEEYIFDIFIQHYMETEWEIEKMIRKTRFIPRKG